MNMHRMESLRERVAAELVRAEGFEPHPGDIENWLDHADRVLAALGLDDLDAAVERAAKALKDDTDEEYGYDTPYDFTDLARTVVEAALTATQAGQTDQEDFDARR